MAKKVKTRKQKMLADLRRTAAPSTEKKLDSTTYSIPQIDSLPSSTPVIQKKSVAKNSIATATYNYLSRDLYKTILLTGLIVIAELGIKFLLKI